MQIHTYQCIPNYTKPYQTIPIHYPYQFIPIKPTHSNTYITGTQPTKPNFLMRPRLNFETKTMTRTITKNF